MAQSKWILQVRLVCILTIVVQVLQVIRNYYFANSGKDPYGVFQPGCYYYHEGFRTVKVALPRRTNLMLFLLLLPLLLTFHLLWAFFRPKAVFFYVHVLYSMVIIFLTVLLGIGTMGTQLEDDELTISKKLCKVQPWVKTHTVLFVIEVGLDVMGTLGAGFLGTQRDQNKYYGQPTDVQYFIYHVPNHFWMLEAVTGIGAAIYRGVTTGIVQAYMLELRQQLRPQPMMNPMMRNMNMNWNPPQFPNPPQLGGEWNGVPFSQSQSAWGPQMANNVVYPSGGQPGQQEQQQQPGSEAAPFTA